MCIRILTAVISGSTSICEGVVTPISIALTGTPPWNVTITNGTQPITETGILVSPYVFSVSPIITSTYWIQAANDAFCNVPGDLWHGQAYVVVFPLPNPFHMNVTNGGVYCEGDSGVVIGLNGSESGMGDISYTIMAML